MVVVVAAVVAAVLVVGHRLVAVVLVEAGEAGYPYKQGIEKQPLPPIHPLSFSIDMLFLYRNKTFQHKHGLHHLVVDYSQTLALDQPFLKNCRIGPAVTRG